MACLADRQYSLNDFERIGCSITSDANVTEDTIKIINALASHVGAPEYQRTPIFKKRNEGRNHHNRRPQRTVITNADWEEMRNFKTTVLEKNEEGIEKEIDSLRMLLNKITSQNYNDMRDNIIKLLTKIIDSNPPEAELLKVGESIFDIGCLNKFWSKLYAQLYKDLIDIFPIMSSIYKKNFESFLGLFDTIRFISAEEDYDKFCEVNKENQKRRAISSFFVHLMKNNVLKTEKVINLINILMEKFNSCISQEGMRNEVDEIGENMCILIKEANELLSDHESFQTISDFVESVADMDHRKYNSLTSKIVFKFMDLCDD